MQNNQIVNFGNWNKGKITAQLIGYYINLSGIILLLLWIGLLKFTPTEAKAIEPLIANSFLMSWMYKVFSLQTTSNIIGYTEIVIAIGLIASIWSAKIGRIVSILGIFTFVTTLSFLFTTPGTWHVVDGIPVTDFFVLKDIACLGFCFIVLGKSLSKQ